MRLRLVPTVAAVLALAACGDRQASKTETAARTPIPAATTAACPPQPAPACPPAAGKFPAKASKPVAPGRAQGKAKRQVAYRRVHSADAARPYEDEEPGWRRRYSGPGRPIPYEEYDSYDRFSERGDSFGYEERREDYDRYVRPDDEPPAHRRRPRPTDRYGPEHGRGGHYDERRYFDDGRQWGYRSRSYGASRESYYESESSSYREERSGDACCTGSSVGAAGFDGYGYLTWPGKIPGR